MSVTPLEKIRQMRVRLVTSDVRQLASLEQQFTDAGFTNISVVGQVHSLFERHVDGQGLAKSVDLVLLHADSGSARALEACRLVTSATGGDVAVIILNTQRLTLDAERCYRAGAVDYLTSTRDLVPRVVLALSLLAERRLRRHRETAWESELAERKIMEARLKHLVSHDDLTGLANRRRLEQALELAIIRSQNFLRTNALLYLDLDQFKVINDTEGHEVGDRLLVNIANKIRSMVKPDQLVARIGSDEFALLLEHISEEEALEFAESIRRALAEHTFDTGNTVYHIGVSIGLVMNTSEEEVTVSELLARADQACYLAKTQGRNTVYLFRGEDAGLNALRSDARWVPIIRQALSDDRFYLVYQPVMHVSSGRVHHYEALIRMDGENDEALAPSEFIPVAERMGLIHQIDLWVVENVLDYMAGLDASLNGVSVGINLSGHAFQDSALLPLIKQKLAMTWVSAQRLTFEITETAAITNFSETREMVARLRALGCRFALDDFGSGFCSFSYIKNYPVDMLKIDGSFVVNLLQDKTDQLLVKSMVDVAHSLGKKVIAEFVENEQTYRKLIELGVDYVQGNYIGSPLPEIELNPSELHPVALAQEQDEQETKYQGLPDNVLKLANREAKA